MELWLKNILKNILNLDLENDFIFFKDSNLKYIYINKRFCELFEIELKDIRGKSDLEALEKNILFQMRRY